MTEIEEFIRYRIDFSEPIELSDFVRAFAAIGSEYERFVSEYHPEYKGDAKVFLRKVEEGSIIAELIAYSTSLLSGMGVSTATEFGKHLGSYLFNAISGAVASKEDPPSKGHLADMRGMLEVVANDKNGRGSLSLYRRVADGTLESEEILHYDTRDARAGIEHIEEAERLLARPERETVSQVMMVFHQINRNIGPLDKRSGDKVVVSAIDPKPKAVVYLSESVQQSVKREINESEENVMKKGYIVDVDVQRLPSGGVAAYILTNIHDSFELPEGEE